MRRILVNFVKNLMLIAFAMVLVVKFTGLRLPWQCTQQAPVPQITNSQPRSQPQEQTGQTPQSTRQPSQSAGQEAARDMDVNIKELAVDLFSKMFIKEHNVKDYYGNSYSSAYVLYGDGTPMDTFRNAVSFLNTGGYRTVRGKVILAGDEKTRDGIRNGFMRVVLLDMNDNILQWSDTIEASSEKESIVDFDISGMKEFKLAVDCTDGNMGGWDMRLIVTEPFTVEKA